MLKGIVGLVTGAASGLGRATAERFVREGGRVVMCDLGASNGAAVAAELGDNAVFVPTDVTSQSDVELALTECKHKFGRLDAAVNCAGVAIAKVTFNPNKKTIHDLKHFETVLKINTLGSFNVASQSCKLIYENEPKGQFGQRGVIVNTSSIAAYEGQMGQSAYAASKAAINGMTLPMARELANSGIRVVTIAPGLFQTPLITALPEKVQAFLAKTVPFPQRMGDPDEFARAVEHVITNEYFNGCVLRLDGALRMQP